VQSRESVLSDDKQAWMDMAETWLEMIPAPERTPEEMFEKAVREQATQQDPSNARHELPLWRLTDFEKQLWNHHCVI